MITRLKFTVLESRDMYDHLHVEVDPIVSLLESSQLKDASGRFFGIVKFTLGTLLSRLARFKPSGFVLCGKIQELDTGFSILVSVDYPERELYVLDILPIAYLDRPVKREVVEQYRELTLRFEKLVISCDLVELLEFTFVP